MTSTTWPDLLTGLVRRDDLTPGDARWAMNEILAGNASSVQAAAFMVALRAKGETVDEVGGLAEAMLENARPVDLPREAVDIVGTGGDRANTVNISTMAALVAAAAGAKVVKHGNRSASSMSGAADVLEALGVVLDLEPQHQRRVYDEVGMVFLFAAFYHPALRNAALPRRELGIATTFNFLGPLANPVRPHAHAIGCADLRMAGLMASVLAGRGARGLVFHGSDGLDELTTTAPSDVWVMAGGALEQQRFDPSALGIPPCRREDLVGGDPQHNADVVRRVFAGERGPVRDIVALNAAAALLAFDGPVVGRGVEEQLADAYGRVTAALDTGAATQLLDRWVALTQELAGR